MKKKMSIMVFFSTLFLLFFFGALANETFVASAKSNHFTLADREFTQSAKVYTKTTQELYIERVLEDGPADKAGLQKGDQILVVNNKPVSRIDEVITMLDAHAPGDLFLITIQRESKTHEVEVTLGKNEQDKAFLGVVLAFEMTIEEVKDAEEIEELKKVEEDEDLAERFLEWVNRWPFHRGGIDHDIPFPNIADSGFEFDKTQLPEKSVLQGAIIRDVLADSYAEEVGLQKNDVITAINDQAVDSLETFEQLLQADSVSESMKLTVERRGEPETLYIELAVVEKGNSHTDLGLQVGFVWHVEHIEHVEHVEGNVPEGFDKEEALPMPSFDEQLPIPPDFERPHFDRPHFEPPSFDFKDRKMPDRPNFLPSFGDFPRPPRFP